MSRRTTRDNEGRQHPTTSLHPPRQRRRHRESRIHVRVGIFDGDRCVFVPVAVRRSSYISEGLVFHRQSYIDSAGGSFSGRQRIHQPSAITEAMLTRSACKHICIAKCSSSGLLLSWSQLWKTWNDPSAAKFSPAKNSKWEDVVFTMLLTSEKDSQRKVFMKNDNYGYMADWHLSLRNVGIKAVIFHDLALRCYLMFRKEKDGGVG